MEKLTNLLKKLRLRQILTIFLAGVAIFVTTACNSGDQLGARPNNPPVQAGGANNPHKGGGDGYTQYNTSTEPRAASSTNTQGRDRADSQLVSNQLIAANSDNLLYPGSGANNSQLPPIVPGSEKALQAPQIPALRQPMVDRNDPDAKILERVGEAFKDAGAFIKDKGDEANARPEMKRNPALEK